MENKYKAAFRADLDASDAPYENIDDEALRIYPSGEEIKRMGIVIIFDEDDSNHVAFRTDPFTTFPEEDIMKGLLLVNRLNGRFRYAKFCLDDDRDLRMEVDAIVDMSTMRSEIGELLARILSIADDAFPEVMRARYA